MGSSHRLSPVAQSWKQVSPPDTRSGSCVVNINVGSTRHGGSLIGFGGFLKKCILRMRCGVGLGLGRQYNK